MPDASTIDPLYQLLGTVVTVIGGVLVALVARNGSKPVGEKKHFASYDDVKHLEQLHGETMASLGSLRVSLHDFWQWCREREEIEKARYEILKEKIK